MYDPTPLLLIESSENHAVLNDPVNEDWVTLLGAITDERFATLARRYHVALTHFREQSARPSLPGQLELVVQGKKQAEQQMLELREQRKHNRPTAQDDGQQVTVKTFVEPVASDEPWPKELLDLTIEPRSLRDQLDRPGRPPCDALCLLRAFLAAPLLGVDDSPISVFRLLHNNAPFAHYCGFLGRGVLRQPGEWTSRRIPSKAMCEEFSEVMTRYGLWHQAKLQLVRENLASGVVKPEPGVAFDTTHIEANSHCANVEPANTNRDKDGKKPKHRKVPRMRKRCTCGKPAWESCEHPWVPTDDGAAVVVKGKSRVYWAHKASVASFAESEVPFDVRVCQYAAQNDGTTLVPHLEALSRELPECVQPLQYILADDAYRHNHAAVARFGQQARLIVPVHGRKASKKLAQRFKGISHFTPSGVPVCDNNDRFQMRGRDLSSERYIWSAPDTSDGTPVCQQCPLASDCLSGGERRHIRVPRDQQPQINWDHPQHLAREQALYSKRTGVERAIKRLKVDLRAQFFTHRDALRAQAHLDRRLLILHLLLAAGST